MAQQLIATKAEKETMESLEKQQRTEHKENLAVLVPRGQMANLELPELQRMKIFMHENTTAVRKFTNKYVLK